MADKTIITFDEIKKEIRKREIKEKIVAKYNQGKEFVIRNKETIITLAPFVIGGLTQLNKTVSKNRDIRREEEDKKLNCYDPHMGYYLRLKRPLTNREIVQIDRRRANGEYLSTILADMKLLK